MKTLKAILLLFAAMAIVTACDPMEDESLHLHGQRCGALPLF